MVKMMCNGVSWNYEEASSFLKEPLFTATRLGIHEIVDELIKSYFYSIFFLDENGYNMFDVAVLYRQEKVFSYLIYKFGNAKDWLGSFQDKSSGNILHLAAKLVSSSEIIGAAFQMQRELQWFKVVQNLFQPSYQGMHDKEGKTPIQLFTKEHEQLIKKGEKWMKETTVSCTVVATLIITVVFPAAYTIPGGNNPKGIPNFFDYSSFMIFSVADAFALFSSTSSLLMFLGILTSRYSQEDFLESLPRKLIIGLVTLFFSIASMMIAFGAGIYMAIFYMWSLDFIPIAILGCVPVTLFASLQFPLLVEMFLSSYRPNIFQLTKDANA